MIASLLGYSVLIKAQIPDCSYLKNENLIVHVPRKIFFPGEDLYYSTMFYNPSSSVFNIKSKVVYFSLINSEGKEVHSWRNSHQENFVLEKTTLPDTIPEGIYSLYAFSSFMRNFPSKYLLHTKIYLFSKTGMEKQFVSPQPLSNIESNSPEYPSISPEYKLKVFTDNKVWSVRRKIVLDVSIEGLEETDSAIVSLSVTHRTNPLLDSSLDQNPVILNNSIEFNDNVRNKGAVSYFEHEGYLLEGFLKETVTGEPVKNEVILLAVKDSVDILEYAITDETGHFIFLTDGFYDEKMLLLHLPYAIKNRGFYSLEINKKSIFPGPVSVALPDKPNRLEEVQELYKKIRMVNLIYDEDREKRKKIPLPHNQVRIRFNPEPDYVVYPADFIKLKNFSEIASNILPLLKFKNKNGQYSLHLYDPETNLSMMENALLLLNGIPFNNYAYLDSLGSDDIKSIAVTSSRTFYGKLTFNGIISIRTYDNTIPKEYVDQQFIINNETKSVQLSEAILQIDEDLVKMHNIPIYRPLMYFNPMIKIQGDKKVSLEFYSSDLKADFLIESKGLVNGTIPISEKMEVSVK